ncbi:hypothetical protein Thimo_2456 [Thioflavicoccus mobilis 8321]|uniref:Uncharacterized protein n=1 Tax=Thioflavicoccus mobilis 8321 TaxID=765912 RepID=L0H0S9_9GAMM|nr:hypothetical protein [Thioflavicoccus mobilis]AGA91189.1 hypothetical protein Thimo_2456 [Thioflavicoccus mobilis 8321]
MKTLITATALGLIANSALAADIYGGFNNPDLDAAYGSHFVRPVPQSQASNFEVSLHAFYEGNPDVTTDVKGYVPRQSSSESVLTAYDVFMLDNPDASPLPHSATMPSQSF